MQLQRPTRDFGAMVPVLGPDGFQVFRNRICLLVYVFALPIFLDVFDGFIIISSYLTVVKWPYHVVDADSFWHLVLLIFLFLFYYSHSFVCFLSWPTFNSTWNVFFFSVVCDNIRFFLSFFLIINLYIVEFFVLFAKTTTVWNCNHSFILGY